MLRPILYFGKWSPPSSAVRMTAKAIGLDLNLREINLLNKEHIREDYLKINPQHTVPVLDDNGFVVSDSHAISTYMIDKYAYNENLYPKDLKKRAVVNQRLHYDGGVLFCCLLGAMKPLVRGWRRTVSPESLEYLEEAYKYMNTILEGKKWLAGDSYTLADISSITTVSSVTVFKSINDHPNLLKWMEDCEQLPGYADIAVPGIKEFHDIVNQFLDK
ncbi:glutathione S-transferase 1-1-like [Microplitis mediator]|uniref:glutathione S-transferase 1-1-like n=1 Tax=Microplitis mediator TaxID=375433 RepID=UPI0025562D3C|nr:glutathione S-transferase 1-1-like [Microplitis mediator]XP_057319781.1 glutathione S-transferase 1-1-like [Microplitis mediator]XP_057319782.1 glutathione S-transferase 1-1-like [Microplitis mediator]XP_057319783.1 glutathione S-transferase 1-1-like [Microplitis mediator]XP_057319784.1 glutathione S-transferase 1-1-like [Microplitis mediator]XP_057319785.1 glutathione S-transferase 1-1-like [Microplitis mediator]